MMRIMPKKDDPQLKFRIPEKMKAELKIRAEHNGRSLNAELLKILNGALEKHSIIG